MGKHDDVIAEANALLRLGDWLEIPQGAIVRTDKFRRSRGPGLTYAEGRVVSSSEEYVVLETTLIIVDGKSTLGNREAPLWSIPPVQLTILELDDELDIPPVSQWGRLLPVGARRPDVLIPHET